MSGKWALTPSDHNNQRQHEHNWDRLQIAIRMTEKMETTNPYCSPLFSSPCTIDAEQSLPGYFVKHFLCFHASFIVGWVFLSCIFTGAVETLSSLTSESYSWLFLIRIGFVVWVAHATHSWFSLSVRKSGPLLNGSVGALAFLACLFVHQVVRDFAPNWISIPWSCTPECVLYSIYFAVSIVAVALLAGSKQSKTLTRHDSNFSDSAVTVGLTTLVFQYFLLLAAEFILVLLIGFILNSLGIRLTSF